MEQNEPAIEQLGLQAILTASGIVLAITGSMLLTIAGHLADSDGSFGPLRVLTIFLMFSLIAGLVSLAAAVDSLLRDKLNIFRSAKLRAKAAHIFLAAQLTLFSMSLTIYGFGLVLGLWDV